MAFCPFLKVASTVRTFFVQLDYLGAAKVLDLTSIQSINTFLRGRIAGLSRRDLVLEEEVGCPIA